MLDGVDRSDEELRRHRDDISVWVGAFPAAIADDVEAAAGALGPSRQAP